MNMANFTTSVDNWLKAKYLKACMFYMIGG